MSNIDFKRGKIARVISSQITFEMISNNRKIKNYFLNKIFKKYRFSFYFSPNNDIRYRLECKKRKT